MHHDQGSLGSEAWERSVERQVQELKQMGVNAIRVTHNPASQVLIDVCNHEASCWWKKPLTAGFPEKQEIPRIMVNGSTRPLRAATRS